MTALSDALQGATFYDVSPLIDASVGTVEVKIRMPNSEGTLPAGMRCSLRY